MRQTRFNLYTTRRLKLKGAALFKVSPVAGTSLKTSDKVVKYGGFQKDVCPDVSYGILYILTHFGRWRKKHSSLASPAPSPLLSDQK